MQRLNFIRSFARQKQISARIVSVSSDCYASALNRGRDYSSVGGSKKSADYVIVGAGSAGSVLTNRLSEDGSTSVLVLEAGPKDYLWDWRIHMPAALMYNLSGDRYNWYYHTVPQQHVDNRVMYWPRGRVWGGSSSLNAMVYIRGNPLDYDEWQSKGADGWSYADVLPYFRKAQCHELGPDDYRGGDGPLHVSKGTSGNPLHDAFLKAGQQAGYSLTSNINGYQQEGVGDYEMTIYKGKRWSASRAYLRPAINRSNVTIESKALTTRVLFEGKRAIGVEYEQNNQLHTVYANKEVILSGGSLNSPQLLMLSGVGPADQLKQHGIDCVQNLPGVGQNMQDHLEIHVKQKCKKPLTLYTAQWKFPHIMAGIGLKWFLTQRGWGATTHLESGGFIRSRGGLEYPDIQWHFLPSTVNDHGRKPGNCHAYQLHAGTGKALSRGTVTLASKNPRDHPLLDPKYLSHPQDIIDLRECLKLSREVFAQEAFKEFDDGELAPGSDSQSDEQIDAYIRQQCDTAYHPSCTCKMGQDNMAVTDNQSRVHGMESLRIVDASIMPTVVNGNLNGPTIMIAEKCADAIRGLPALPKSDAPVWRPKYPHLQRDSLGS